MKGQKTAFSFIEEFGRTCPPMHSVTDTGGKPKSRNLSVNWYDMSIREKERQTEQFIRNSCPMLKLQVRSNGGAFPLTVIKSTSPGKAATKQDSSIVRILATNYCTLEPFKDTGGKMIKPEMMGHICIPLNWKQSLFHTGFSFDLNSILDAGRIAGGREGRENRHTVFISPSKTVLYGRKEEYCRDLTQPRKVHCITGWKYSQNVVYWIHLDRAQEKGIAFWQTKSHAFVKNSTVPPDFIERVVSQRGEMTIYQNSSSKRQPVVASI